MKLNDIEGAEDNKAEFLRDINYDYNTEDRKSNRRKK